MREHWYTEKLRRSLAVLTDSIISLIFESLKQGRTMEGSVKSWRDMGSRMVVRLFLRARLHSSTFFSFSNSAVGICLQSVSVREVRVLTSESPEGSQEGGEEGKRNQLQFTDVREVRKVQK